MCIYIYIYIYTYIYISILEYDRISTLGLAFVLFKSNQFNKSTRTNDSQCSSVHVSIALCSTPTRARYTCD